MLLHSLLVLMGLLVLSKGKKQTCGPRETLWWRSVAASDLLPADPVLGAHRPTQV